MWEDPEPFDVAWCRFPYSGGGTQHHPCLVLQEDAVTRAGLTNPTAFQLQAQFVLKLPWSPDWFSAAPGKKSPVMGRVDIASERMRYLFKAAVSTKFAQHVNSL